MPESELTLFEYLLPVLSIIGSLFNAVTTCYLKAYTSGIGKIVLALSAFDIILALGNFLCGVFSEEDETGPLLIFLFGWNGAIIWPCCLAHCLLLTLKRLDETIPDQFFRRYLIISIISPALWTAIGLTLTRIKNKLGEEAPFDLNIISYLIPPLLGSLFCFICYILVVKQLKKMRAGNFWEMLLYPLILILCNLPYSIIFCRELLQTEEENQDQPWWSVMFDILFNLQGLLNAFAYGLSKRIRTGYKEQCSCKKRNADHKVPLLRKKIEVPKFVVEYR